VPAGGALAVDRDGFSAPSPARSHASADRDRREEIAACRRPTGTSVIVATGPLTSPPLAEAIANSPARRARLLRRDRADRAPRFHRHVVAWFQSRYDKVGPGGTGADYINCPMTREQYDAFVDALLAGEKTEFKEWEPTRPISTAACRSR
jgi:methylenetetrahydrofolate--tRNA-(uracil-5-)-methyltransferase